MAPYWDDDDGTVLSTTVDGVHYLIDEPQTFPTSFDSHTFGKNAAIDYEICVYAHKNEIAWLHGPFPAGTNDKDISEKTKVRN